MEALFFDINLGFLLSGVLGLFWAYQEIKYLDSETIRNLKSSLVFPRTVMSQKNNGKLVYIQGPLKPHQSLPLTDDFFYVAPSLKLRKTVEMYQYYKEGNKFLTKWLSHPVDSKLFDESHKNPSWMFFSYEKTLEKDLEINGILVDCSVLKKINSWKITTATYKFYDFNQIEKDEELYLIKDKKLEGRPKVGNYRLGFKHVPSEVVVSAIGMQLNGRLVPYKGVFIVKEGFDTVDELFEELETNEFFKIWGYRILCGYGMVWGVRKGLDYLRSQGKNTGF